ncbi:hypothetical protein K474DRAFT_1259905 [Panus rudis PR-1116 ss-1]|nr:hypothetical protein K474DRAFT_1259905 [Panus rudis PR-1116 ss-1]
MQVDVVDSHGETSSAQNGCLQDHQLQDDRGFTQYRSFFSRYPLLRLHLQRIPGYPPQAQPTASETSMSSSNFSLANLDLQPLKVIAMCKYIQDPSKRICQYEIPGGGECRDQTYVAEYLATALPTGSRRNTQDVKQALEAVRQRHTVSSSTPTRFEDRVKEALASLGLR